MAYWHTGAPNSGAAYGWLGRLADGMDPPGTADYLVNIDSHQSLAVRARSHVPLVFDDPDKFLRTAAFEEESALRAVVTSREVGNPTQRFLLEVAQQRGECRAALAAGMRRISHAGRLWVGAVRTRQGGGADCCRLPHAHLLRGLSQQRLRYPRAAGRCSCPAADLHVGPHRGVPARHGRASVAPTTCA